MADRPHRRPTRHAGRAPLPHGLVTTRALDLAGWTEAARRHALRRGDLERLRRGVLGTDEPVDPALGARRSLEAANLRSARATALLCPRAVISHFPAAIAYGMPVYGALGRPCLTVAAGTALRELARVHLHRATLIGTEVSELNGYQVTSPARTVMDVAREHGVAAGVVAADDSLHRGLVDPESLGAAFEMCAGWPGRKAARIVLRSADGRAESPLESLSRLRIAAARLPPPRLQPLICDEFGRFLGPCDLYWDEFGVVGEADGDLKYDRGKAAIVEERLREKELAETGLIIVRWGWADLYAFEGVARRLQAAFARGARVGAPDRRWGILRPSSGLHP